MKKWIQKFMEQLDTGAAAKSVPEMELSEERATLVFLIDVMGKHIIETENNSIRRVRDTLDSFAKALVNDNDAELEKTLFRVRQFLSSHRIDEYSYVQKSFDEFRKIIWDFIENLSQDVTAEQKDESSLEGSLNQLRDAVESNSMDQLKSQSKQFIQTYIQHQTKKNQRRTKRIDGIKKNLTTVKKQLVEAHDNLKVDHLTQAYNRKSFDEHLKQQWNLFQLSKQPVALVMLDIDHFKKINDNYGHAMGDYVLIECVKLLKSIFARDNDFVARIGGEEFAVVLPDFNNESALKKVESALAQIRGETLVDKDMRVKFTMSAGIAQLLETENTTQWMKRADAALYTAKNSGRDKAVVATALTLQQPKLAV